MKKNLAIAGVTLLSALSLLAPSYTISWNAAVGNPTYYKVYSSTNTNPSNAIWKLERNVTNATTVTLPFVGPSTSLLFGVSTVAGTLETAKDVTETTFRPTGVTAVETP